jgi:uncharacterized membrane protein
MSIKVKIKTENNIYTWVGMVVMLAMLSVVSMSAVKTFAVDSNASVIVHDTSEDQTSVNSNIVHNNPYPPQTSRVVVVLPPVATSTPTTTPPVINFIDSGGLNLPKIEPIGKFVDVGKVNENLPSPYKLSVTPLGLYLLEIIFVILVIVMTIILILRKREKKPKLLTA